MQSYSQIGQDMFVLEVMKNKTNGTFLDVGCSDYERLSNTYLLEKEFNWRGVAIDLCKNDQEGWLNNRPNSVFVLGDALKIDYEKLLTENNLGMEIDYLSIDLEPPATTLNALYKIFESDISFKVITFEHDSHKDPNVQGEARNFLSYKGYRLIKTVIQDDYFVSEELFNSLSL